MQLLSSDARDRGGRVKIIKYRHSIAKSNQQDSVAHIHVARCDQPLTGKHIKRKANVSSPNQGNKRPSVERTVTLRIDEDDECTCWLSAASCLSKQKKGKFVGGKTRYPARRHR